MTDFEFFRNLFKDKKGVVWGDCEIDGGPGTIMIINKNLDERMENMYNLSKYDTICLYFDPENDRLCSFAH